MINFGNSNKPINTVPERLLVINFSSSELNEMAKAQIRRETHVHEMVEVHVPCQFNLSKPLPPQIANVMTLADQMARERGFQHGLMSRVVVVPPGFADAAFIMGAWLAYAAVNVTSPLRTMRFNTGWTAMLFEPQSLMFPHKP
jgi:hypothetical protein